MKDGRYSMHFSAAGYDSEGTFLLQGNRGRGDDGQFKLEGRLMERSNNLTASFDVLMTPAATMNSRLPAHYSLDMTGTANDEGFTLIGTGPLGVIVDIGCAWVGPLANDGR